MILDPIAALLRRARRPAVFYAASPAGFALASFLFAYGSGVFFLGSKSFLYERRILLLGPDGAGGEIREIAIYSGGRENHAIPWDRGAWSVQEGPLPMESVYGPLGGMAPS